MSKKKRGVLNNRQPAKAVRLPQVIGAMKATQAADRLAAAGDKKTAEKLRAVVTDTGRDVKLASIFRFWDDPPAYSYTDHAFGYIPPPDGSRDNVIDISDAGNIKADTSLKNQEIKVTLDRLRVFDYPGKSEHTVLIDFYAKHQTSTPNQSEDLHFTQKYRAVENSGVGIRGYDIFIGLKVGKEGVSFRCYTVNVENKDDKGLLAFLDSDVFKKGLGLIESVNPVIPILSGFATGIISMFAHRHDNVPVQDFFLGLDFSTGATGARLREGSYVAVQVPDAAKWDWSGWVLNRANNQVVSKQDLSKSIPLNYIIFRIDKMQA